MFGVEFLEGCSVDGGLLNILAFVRKIITYLQIIIPIALILWGTIDMGKAVIAGDEKKIKEKQKPFIHRLIAAIIVFLIPWIVNLVINIVVSNANGWVDCWNKAGDTNYTAVDPTNLKTNNNSK